MRGGRLFTGSFPTGSVCGVLGPEVYLGVLRGFSAPQQSYTATCLPSMPAHANFSIPVMPKPSSFEVVKYLSSENAGFLCSLILRGAW